MVGISVANLVPVEEGGIGQASRAEPREARHCGHSSNERSRSGVPSAVVRTAALFAGIAVPFSAK